MAQEEANDALEDQLIAYKDSLDVNIWKLQAFVGKDALDVCPVCNHKQSFMEVKADNYE